MNPYAKMISIIVVALDLAPHMLPAITLVPLKATKGNLDRL